MIIDLTGKKVIAHITSTTCEYHKKNPGVPYAGCCCSAGYSQQIVDDPTPPKRQCDKCHGTGEIE